MAGVCRSESSPSTKITTNHSARMGPNATPTRPDPCGCIANSATRISTVSGTIYGWKAGVTSSSPSTALSTEMAGVIKPSPYSMAVPIMAR